MKLLVTPSNLETSQNTTLDSAYRSAEMVIFLKGTNRVIIINTITDTIETYDEVDDFRNDCGMDRDTFYSTYEPFHDNELKEILENVLDIKIQLILLNWF